MKLTMKISNLITRKYNIHESNLDGSFNLPFYNLPKYWQDDNTKDIIYLTAISYNKLESFVLTNLRKLTPQGVHP